MPGTKFLQNSLRRKPKQNLLCDGHVEAMAFDWRWTLQAIHGLAENDRERRRPIEVDLRPRVRTLNEPGWTRRERLRAQICFKVKWCADPQALRVLGFEPKTYGLKGRCSNSASTDSAATYANPPEEFTAWLTYLQRTSPDLAALVKAWPELPDAVRVGIVALVSASAPDNATECK